jgi:hypothetical protein
VVHDTKTSERGEDEMPFYIQSIHSGKYLDIKGGNKHKGAQVIIWDFNGAKNQQWTYKKGMIISKLNGLALDISGAQENGEIVMWTDHGGNNQKWNFDDDLTIRSELGTVLDVKDGSRENNSQLIATSSAGREHQKFRIVPVPE